MRKVFCIVAAMLSTSSVASEVIGVSSMEIISSVTPGLKALGIESAKVNGLNNGVSFISKGDRDNIEYVFAPTILETQLIHQLEVDCGLNRCLDTKVKLILDDDIIKTISSRIRKSTIGLNQSNSDVKSVYAAQLEVLDTIQTRYSQLPINKYPAETIYSLWINLTAKEVKQQLYRKISNSLLESLSTGKVTASLKRASVFNRPGEMLNSRYSGYAFSLGYDSDLEIKKKSEKYKDLVSDTRYVSMTFALPEVSTNLVEFRARYSCLMFKSPEDYLKNQSVLSASLLHQEHEVVLKVKGESYRVGRGYYYKGKEPKKLKARRGGVPAYCSLSAGEILIENDDVTRYSLPNEITIEKVFRLYNVDVDFKGDDEGISNWLMVDSYFDKEWVYGRYRDDVESIENGCSTSSCISRTISVEQFKAMTNSEPHVAFTDVAARASYPFRIERYHPKSPLKVPHMGMQAGGYTASGLTLLDW